MIAKLQNCTINLASSLFISLRLFILYNSIIFEQISAMRLVCHAYASLSLHGSRDEKSSQDYYTANECHNVTTLIP